MTEESEEYPDPSENLHNRPICLYVTDIPQAYVNEDIEYIFGKISQDYLKVSKVESAPCFYDPYDKKCAYIYFDHWFSASEEIAIIESHFILNTFYKHILPRTWTEYWQGEPIKSLKIFYCRKPPRNQSIRENWNFIKEQNVFQEIRRQAHQIRCLKKRVSALEDKKSTLSVILEQDENENEGDDMSSYHNIS